MTYTDIAYTTLALSILPHNFMCAQHTLSKKGIRILLTHEPSAQRHHPNAQMWSFR